MENDPIFGLLHNDFDEKVFVSKILENKNPSENLTMVSNLLSELDASIFNHVSEHNTELLNQTVDLEHFANMLNSVESKIRGVANDVNKIRQRLAKPHNYLSTQVIKIRRLGILCETLRKILRISSNIRRLKQSASDLVNASECINELEYAFKSIDWKGITALEEYHKLMITERQKIEEQARKMIDTSFNIGDQSHLVVGLQVFENLSMLPNLMLNLIYDWQTEIESAVQVAVDVDDLTKRAKQKVISSLTSAGPGRASMASGAGGAQAAAFRSLFWRGVDSMIGVVERCLSRVRLLAETLRKKRISAKSIDEYDNENIQTPTTLASRLCLYAADKWMVDTDCCIAIVITLTSDEKATENFMCVPSGMEGTENVREAFKKTYAGGLLCWATNCMGTLFEPALRRRSGQLNEMFEGEYPRLLKLFLGLIPRRQIELQSELPHHLRKLLMPYETAYLSRSLSRIFDRVNSTFIVGGTAPDYTDVDRLVQVVASELTHAEAVHYGLFCKVAKNVAKMVGLFATKVEALIGVGPKASQVTDPRTPMQESNTHLVNLICSFVDRLRLAVARHTVPNKSSSTSIITDENEDPQAIIDAAIISKLNGLCLTTLEPLLTAIADHLIGQLIPKMHTDQGILGDAGTASCYVQEMQKFLQDVRNNLLTGFLSASNLSSRHSKSSYELYTSGESALQSGLRTFVTPLCLDAFIVNMSLVRPAEDESVRLRLTTNCAEVEVIFSELTNPATLPEVFSRLRAFRQLLLVPSDEIKSTFEAPLPTNKSRQKAGFSGLSLPGSLILHHIISRAPAEIPSPFAASDWSLDRYILWCLRNADESARIAFIGRAVAVYIGEVEARKQRQYPSIFPLIRNLLELFEQSLSI